MDNNASACVKTFWYHGFTYNATFGSRTQIPTVITEGMFFCLDIEAHVDLNVGAAAQPTGSNIVDYGPVNLKPNPTAASLTDAGYAAWALSRIVTKPYTNSLPAFAGVVVGRKNAKKWGAQSYGAGPQYLDLATGGEVVMCRLNGTFMGNYTEIMLSNDSFYGVPFAPATSAYAGVANTGQIVTGTNTALADNLLLRRAVVGVCLLPGTYTGAELVPCRIYNTASAS